VDKIFEKILTEQLTNHLESNNLLSPSQHGFRRGLSCETALNTIVEHWRANIDNKKTVVSVFLDLKKAFDTINHDLLLYKLNYYNVSHKSINLISSYLHDRRYAIRYSGAQSNFAKLDTGIPQGSSLGPLLFLVYINDLALLHLPSQLFADDTTISAAGESYGEACRIIAIDLELICTWLSHNRLVVNWSKTNHMLIGSSTNDASLLAINGNTLERLNSVKLLGVEIDSQLKFEKQINVLCSKVNKKAYLISRRFFLFDIKFRTTLFKLFIIPHFEYCSSLFYNTYSSITATLFKCFKKNLKLFLNIDIHNKDLHMQLSVLQPFNILPISKTFHSLLHIYSLYFLEFTLFLSY
jgi:ribonuclease P/MRP protein subunit RPP40